MKSYKVNMKKTSKIIVTMLLACYILPANAQKDSNKVVNLNEVIVTGQYKPQTLKKSVYQIKVINSERIQQSAATNVQQVLIKLISDQILATMLLQNHLLLMTF